ncbi:MAG: hypothetical protein GW949_05400 [Spirochaetales bacterium]|nr:hypothetical protein [Spirochaetales bacterium]
MREIASSQRVAFLDLTTIARQGLDDPSLVAGDGLHLSAKAYALFAQRVVQDILCRL